MKYAVEFLDSAPARCTLDIEHVGNFVPHRIGDGPRAVWQATQVTGRTCQTARDDTIPSTETP